MKSKTKGKTKKRAGSKAQATLVAFLLDRSGSMGAVKAETISGFNSYVDELEKKCAKMRFTLTQFDSEAVDIVQDAVPIKEVKRLTDGSYVPRSWTPLYDAMGRTIRRTAAAAKGSKVLFVTLTDGQENASTEFTQASVKELIKEKEGEHWTFAYVGVGPEGWSAIASVSAGTIGASNVLNTTTGNTRRAYARMATDTVTYSSCIGSGLTSQKNMFSNAGLDKDDE